MVDTSTELSRLRRALDAVKGSPELIAGFFVLALSVAILGFATPIDTGVDTLWNEDHTIVVENIKFFDSDIGYFEHTLVEQNGRMVELPELQGRRVDFVEQGDQRVNIAQATGLAVLLRCAETDTFNTFDCSTSEGSNPPVVALVFVVGLAAVALIGKVARIAMRPRRSR